MSIEKTLQRAVIALETIAAAQVAQALALSKFGVVEFDAEGLLQRLEVSPRTTNAPSQPSTVRVPEVITQYVQTYKSFISRKHAGKNGAWIMLPRTSVRARYTVEANNTFTLCLPVIRFREWALEQGIHSDQIKQWAKDNNITQKQERIAPKTDAVSCFLIPRYSELDTDNGEIKTK